MSPGSSRADVASLGGRLLWRVGQAAHPAWERAHELGKLSKVSLMLSLALRLGLWRVLAADVAASLERSKAL